MRYIFIGRQDAADWQGRHMEMTLDRERFDRVIRLYGEGADRFPAAHVIVVGMGGVGSWAAEALARTGIGRLTLVDGDSCEESNTNRQCHALEGNYGRSKAELMAERVLRINPACRVEAIAEMLAPDSLDSVLPDADALIDAIDMLKSKAALVAWARGRGMFAVTSGGGAGRRDPSKVAVADVSRVTDDPLIGALRKELRTRYGFPRGMPKGKSPLFHLPAVYSTEPVRLVCGQGTKASGNGKGAVMTVTATFGLRLASLVLDEIAAGNGRSSESDARA